MNEVNANEFNPVAVVESAPVAVSNPGTIQNFMDEDERFIADLTTRTVSYCSLVPKNEEEKAFLYNAQNNTPNKVKDCIGETINLKHVYVEAVHLTNKETGEVQAAPRIVLIDENLNSFQCVSIGIYSAIKKIFGIYGTPDKWEKPLPIKIKLINKSADRSILTIDIVTAKK